MYARSISMRVDGVKKMKSVARLLRKDVVGTPYSARRRSDSLVAFTSFYRLDWSCGRNYSTSNELLGSRRNPRVWNEHLNRGVIRNSVFDGISKLECVPFIEDWCRRYNGLYSGGSCANARHGMTDDATAHGRFAFTLLPSKREKASGVDGCEYGSLNYRWGGQTKSLRRTELHTRRNHSLTKRQKHVDVGQNSNMSNSQALTLTSSEKAGKATRDIQKLGYEMDDQETRHASAQATALLRAALDEKDDEEGTFPEECQRSLRVGIVGAPNAGKSLLTNQLVGTRVSAVSPKTNTTHRDHLGIFTKDETQLLYYDTPGLHLAVEGTPLRVDVQHRVRNAWDVVDLCDALVVLIDAERQIRRPDKRVLRLVEKFGSDQTMSQKRVLCLNKVDIIEQKRQLLPLAKQFEDFLGYDRIFMISGKTGSGVEDVKDYLLNEAVLRPWDADPHQTDQRDVSLEVVRERVFEKLHEELPHTTKQKLVSWKVLKDGSVRIQQVLLVPKKEHQKILVGTNGAVIGEIGIKARKELQQILGTTVHLVLDVKSMSV